MLRCANACTAGCGSETLVLRAIFGSYVQTQGPSHGVLWDPETLEPLVDTPAMEAALAVSRWFGVSGASPRPAPTSPGPARPHVRLQPFCTLLGLGEAPDDGPLLVTSTNRTSLLTPVHVDASRSSCVASARWAPPTPTRPCAAASDSCRGGA